MKLQRELRDKTNRHQALQAKYNTLEQVDYKINAHITQPCPQSDPSFLTYVERIGEDKGRGYIIVYAPGFHPLRVGEGSSHQV